MATTLGRVLAGRLVVFEGPDGAGKTTIVRSVSEALRSNGIVCEACAFPGSEKGTVGRLIYQIHHDPAKFDLSTMTALSLQSLHVAAHVDAIDRWIKPRLASGTCILLDRFWWSTWVYGLVAGVPAKALRALIEFERNVWGSTEPKAIVLVTRPGATDPALDAQYDRLARRERQCVQVIRLQNSGSVESACDAAISALVPSSRSRRGGKR